MHIATLLLNCPDRTGIIAKISNFLFINNCNIIQSDQYSTGHEGGHFFIRVKFAFNPVQLDKTLLQDRTVLIAQELNAQCQLFFEDEKKRMGILVSKYDHCLLDILYRYRTGEFTVNIPMVISNHDDLKDLVESYGIPFYHIPTRPDKTIHEQAILELVQPSTDFLVLARYMQIISPDFLNHYDKKIINIHHSFLPSFKGANPYKQAWERGVKVIGATAHYVTCDLDEGPIITQEVEKVTHKDSIETLTQKGRDIEKIVLSQAIRAQLDDRVIEFGNKTIVFD